MFIAHKKEDGTQQSIREHLEGVRDIVKRNVGKFHEENLGEILGLLHDIGKYSKGFQNRILNEGPRVDHSTAGAQLAEFKYGFPISTLLNYCILGHHGGMPDYGSPLDNDETGTLCGRLKKNVLEYNSYQQEILLPEKIAFKAKKSIGQNGFSLFLLIKMLFSSLVDGDYTDTSEFMNPEKNKKIDYNIADLELKMNKKIEELKNSETAYYPINQRRTKILDSCIENAKEIPGLFTLSVPTGGGKTFSSMAFAVQHARKYHMDRIIYVIPYISIIEQNASVFKEIFGADLILEHHSNFSLDDQTEDITYRYKLATETWEIPIVVTTNVQFFESFFKNKPSQNRKLHNISNSVIIFDEAHMFPNQYLLLFSALLLELCMNYKSSVVLCSATQPQIDQYIINPVVKEKINIREINNSMKEDYEYFKRIKINNMGKVTEDEIIQSFTEKKQVLCIVNTKKTAKIIYEKIAEDSKKENTYYLTTYMCPIHRREILTKIKNHLKMGEPCLVVATSLIEAGVDVDFEFVYREINGLDSILQAAGRCNREGKKIVGDVFIFELENSARLNPSLKRKISITREVLRKFQDISSIEAIKYYFEHYYKLEDLDQAKILEKINSVHGCRGEFNFRNIDENFLMIGKNTISVIIDYDEKSKRLLQTLKYSGPNIGLMRALQEYTVNIYVYEADILKKNNNLIPGDYGLYILKSDLNLYSAKTGLNIAQEETGDALFYNF